MGDEDGRNASLMRGSGKSYLLRIGIAGNKERTRPIPGSTISRSSRPPGVSICSISVIGSFLRPALPDTSGARPAGAQYDR